jgi:hypothetical protein
LYAKPYWFLLCTIVPILSGPPHLSLLRAARKCDGDGIAFLLDLRLGVRIIRP